MAGPTFSFWYRDFTTDHADKLELLVREVGAAGFRRLDPPARLGKRAGLPFHVEFAARFHGEPTGLMGVAVHARDAFPPSTHAAWQATLGFVPRFELGGYCMAKGDADWGALRELAERIAEELGGWVIAHAERHALPELPDASDLERVLEVVVRDEASFFGAMIADAAYVEAHRHLVPEERRWVIPATVGRGSFWVGK